MPLSFAARRRVVNTAARLLALREEHATPAQAVELLAAQQLVPAAPAGGDPAPLSAAIGASAPDSAARIADYVRNAELQGRGDEVLRFISQLDTERRRWQGPLFLAFVEFVTALFVVSVYALFVLPVFRSVFESMGVPLPHFTQMITTLVAPGSLFSWFVALLLLIMFLWRFVSLLLGPLLLPLDRLALSLPGVGAALQRRNALRMSGWLGFCGNDTDAQRTALEAAQAWHPRGIFSRVCEGALAQLSKQRGALAWLCDSAAFDREFRRALSMPNHADCQLALRGRWRTSWSQPEIPFSTGVKLVHVLAGIVIGAIIIALYLPIFKLAGMN